MSSMKSRRKGHRFMDKHVVDGMTKPGLVKQPGLVKHPGFVKEPDVMTQAGLARKSGPMTHRSSMTRTDLMEESSLVKGSSEMNQTGLTKQPGFMRRCGLMTQPGPSQDPADSSRSVAHAISAFAKKVFDFVFPEEEGCVLCGKVADSRHSEEVFFAAICGDCLSRIPFVQAPICDICGRPLRGQAVDITGRGRQSSIGDRERLKTQASLIPGVEGDASGVLGSTGTQGRAVCSDCERQGRFFTRARAVGTYDGVLRELIREFKFYGRRDLAEGLGVLMAREVSQDIRMRRCDVIVPVPLHPIRLAERGYNQAELLAKEVGFCFGMRVQDSVERLIGPGEQNKLGRRLRKDHIRGAFNVPYPARIAGKRVLLVDDVITTGNTANECARALLRVGAAEVHVIAAAISPFEQEWLVH